MASVIVAPAGFWKFGIVYSRRGVLTGLAGGRQGIDVEPVGGQWNGQEVNSVELRLQQGAVVGRRLHREQIAGDQELLQQEDEALERAGRDDDALCTDIVLGREERPQRRVPRAVAVGEDPDMVVAEGRLGRSGDELAVKGFRAWRAAREGDGVSHAGESTDGRR